MKLSKNQINIFFSHQNPSLLRTAELVESLEENLPNVVVLLHLIILVQVLKLQRKTLNIFIIKGIRSGTSQGKQQSRNYVHFITHEPGVLLVDETAVLQSSHNSASLHNGRFVLGEGEESLNHALFMILTFQKLKKKNSREI